MNISKLIEDLLKYAAERNLVAGLDVPLSRNLLLDLLQAMPFEGNTMDGKPCTDLTAILDPILDYAYEKRLFAENTITHRDLFEGKIMGMLTPRQSEVESTFLSLEKNQGVEAATDFFYKLSVDTNYIKTKRIQKNLHWLHKTEYGNLEITINLSKPEKDPREIALAREMPSTSYPKCLLCVENVGFAGHMNHPARQNHRIIPITLGGEEWFLQYSPYLYYNEHCIPLCAKHQPININSATFEKLLDFLERFPHYFVGSNADIPIVGGSLLTHDHFQGGRHTFPIETAKTIKKYTIDNVHTEIVKWPMSVIRIKSADRKKLTKVATAILQKWKTYEDASVDVIPFTGETPHNTITPIARINAAKEYELDLVLRNNRTNEEYPDGIFHPHPHVHHIKKENIGLIEVMGLAILPGRLADDVVNAKNRKDIETYMGEIFLEVLTHAGVFKTNSRGLAAFERFLSFCGAE